MLQTIRDNAQGLVSKILVGLIAFTFVIWGADSLFTSHGYDNSPVTVNGEEISVQDWLQASELQRRQILINNPDIDPATIDINAIQSSTLEQMIREQVLLQFADNYGLAISDSAIDRMIIESADFQVDGQFNLQRFEGLVANAGMTVNSYKSQLMQSSLINQIQQGIALSAFTLPEQAQKVAALDGQTRDIATLMLSFSEQFAITQISDDDVLEYYEANTEQYQSSEQVKVNYIVLDQNSFIDKVNITDDALLAAYQDGKAQYEAEAAQERSVAHILFNVDEQQSEEQALSLAQAAYKQLESGRDFASVVMEFSQDIGSADTGGDLGPITVGGFGGDFDTALANLNDGEYSQPIVTQFGVQIIQSTLSQVDEYPSFEQQVDSIKENLQSQETLQLFIAASNTMEDLAFSTTDLQELSDELNLTIQTSAWFERSGAQEFSDQAQRVANAAFTDDVLQGNNSEIIVLASDKIAVLSLNEYKPQQLQEFSEVQQLVRDQLTSNKALSDLQAKAEGLLERLQQGEDASALATEVGATWQVSNGVARGGSEVSALINQAAFRLPRPSTTQTTFGTSTDYSGDIALIQLLAVNDANINSFSEEEQTNLFLVVSRLNGQADVAALNTNINNQADIEYL